MPRTDALRDIRAAAKSFEEGLPLAQRKRLGQFFTGLPLGTLLAHLASDASVRTVLDPMCGHGDLLDAASIAAQSKGICLDRLDGIELDSQTAAFSQRRASALRETGSVVDSRIITGSAFDPAVIAQVDASGYDLVITNPPYVRYQSQNESGSNISDVRRGLSAIVESRTTGEERELWKSLVEGYSGLADLSVPSWLLAALLTRPGGRVALVVPATWRSRDYADVVRYLLLRAFNLEFIVADSQPGWFPGALVRAHLVIARRLLWDEAQTPVSDRSFLPDATWLQISPSAVCGESLVGAAFPGVESEQNFAAWAGTALQEVESIEKRPFSLDMEWRTLEQRLQRKTWLQKVEGSHSALPILSVGREKSPSIPHELRRMLPVDVVPACLQTIEEAGIQVGQGLRTGCNKFFYVKLLDGDEDEAVNVNVEGSSSFNKVQFRTPRETLRPVLHRQADMHAFEKGCVPLTRVLDLSDWVLPEDHSVVLDSAEAYRSQGISQPRVMPPELASFVRRASRHAPNPKYPARLIPDLSAVRTNVRQPTNNRNVPRFWYMLPAFTARHMPAIFMPRINHNAPVVALNTHPAILIDANFSTLWSDEIRWSRHALYALFSSTWCRAALESAGTPLAAGALKLEATHIRQVLIPRLSDQHCDDLGRLGQQLAEGEQSAHHRIDMIVLGAIFPGMSEASLKEMVCHIGVQLDEACIARKRTYHDS